MRTKFPFQNTLASNKFDLVYKLTVGFLGKGKPGTFSSSCHTDTLILNEAILASDRYKEQVNIITHRVSQR